jgi:sorbitol-6-phosphate 2-dehydrogenase
MNTQLINIIAPALRGLLSTSETLKLITFHAQHSAPAPLVFETANDEGPKKLVDRLRTAINAHKTAPSAVHVKNLGYFTAADPPTTGRVAGKVALVTGAAQGFGLEIAQHLATQGAHVALADVNIEGARKAAADINSQHDPNRALGLSINVADPASVDSALHELVKNFGGLDILISNAGVLRAGSVKTLSDKDFDLSTNVNYKGYFLCVQKSAPIMATQRLAKPDTFFDIIQINSKSGLQGSNRNGAYAGSKFGGIGLTQSFALELIEDNIKVNSICPGNFFDGPLWSDPTNGLFVQYLRTGKVPGAKTIEDVKKSYESKVPMNRGCRTADVMTAIYYLIEQKYETGQALPVTGGQVMLS